MPCRATTWTLGLVAAAAAAAPLRASALTPTWPPTYDMALSSTVMPCNNAELMSSGPNWPAIRSYGLIDIDWSNAKQKWINTSPMSCEEDLLKQAELIKANNTLGASQKVWVYRNGVWAMPWMTHTRKLLDDPAYDVWFLKFKNGSDGRGPLHHDGDGTYKSPVCDHNFSPPKCSELYHAQSQTPGYPHGDGNCDKPCDCGRLPCGPYLFDHRQGDTKVKGQTLREWFVAEMFGGPTGLDSPAISGFYIDDWWPKADHHHSWPPHMNNSQEQWEAPYGNGGAGDMDGSELADIGLSANDVDDLHAAWVSNMKTVVTGEKAVLFVRLYVKMIILPRQARDKHWENAKKSAVFLQRLFPRAASHGSSSTAAQREMKLKQTRPATHQEGRESFCSFHIMPGFISCFV